MTLKDKLDIANVLLLAGTVILSFIATIGAIRAARSSEKTYLHMIKTSKIDQMPYLALSENEISFVESGIIIILKHTNTGKTLVRNAFIKIKFYNYYLNEKRTELVFRDRVKIGDILPNETKPFTIEVKCGDIRNELSNKEFSVLVALEVDFADMHDESHRRRDVILIDDYTVKYGGAFQANDGIQRMIWANTEGKVA